MHLYRCPAMAEVVKAVIPTFDKVLELDLPPHLFAGMPHTLPADPRIFDSAPNETISSPTIDCVHLGEAFGTPYEHIPIAIPGNTVLLLMPTGKEWEYAVGLLARTFYFLKGEIHSAAVRLACTQLPYAFPYSAKCLQ